MQITASMVKELREVTGAGMSACKNALTEAAGDMKRAQEILREKGLAAAAKKAGRIAAEGLVAVAVSDDKKSAALVEVNSETDFVAKNEEFVTFVQNMATQALASNAATPEALLEEAWITDKSMTAKDVLTNKVATIGENIGLRRFEKYVSDGVVIEYIHGGGRVGVMIDITADTIDEKIQEAGKNVCMQIAALSPQFVSKDHVPPEFVASEKEFFTQQANKENQESASPKPEAVITKMVEGRLAKSLKETCLLDQEYVKDGEFTVGSYLKSVNPSIKVNRFIRFEKGEGIEKKSENFADEVAKAMNV